MVKNGAWELNDFVELNNSGYNTSRVINTE